MIAQTKHANLARLPGEDQSKSCRQGMHLDLNLFAHTGRNARQIEMCLSLGPGFASPLFDQCDYAIAAFQHAQTLPGTMNLSAADSNCLY